MIEQELIESHVESQNIFTDTVADISSLIRKIITGPVIKELLSMATLIKASSDNEAIIAAVIAAGVAPTQAPSVVAGVIAGILTIEAIIKHASATPNPTAS
jgi:hypothetical protein